MVKMTRLSAIILTILTLFACSNNEAKKQLTKLEQYVNSADSLTSKSNFFDQIATKILTEKKEIKPSELKLFNNDTTGKTKEQTFQFQYDTTGKHSDVTNNIRITEYQSDRHAANAFLDIVEFEACCIPDEDIVRLKNFENLGSFKNIASTTLLSENLAFEVCLGDNSKDNQEVLNLLDNILVDRKYLKLEIGYNGPAIWTIK